jgi:Ca2+-binding RTX toxin-like protein
MWKQTQRQVVSACTGVIEVLEQRQLLSAAIVSGTLKITGSSGHDDILLRKTSAGIIVGVNGHKQRFSTRGVRRISIDAGRGNDFVDDRVNLPSTILGGAGNDVLLGSAADDSINGGSGRDSLNGNKGDDSINGGIGDDSLRGGAGDDSLDGGSGNDNLLGEAGDDSLNGGDGDDDLDGGIGTDHLLGGSGNDDNHDSTDALVDDSPEDEGDNGHDG